MKMLLSVYDSSCHANTYGTTAIFFERIAPMYWHCQWTLDSRHVMMVVFVFIVVV